MTSWPMSVSCITCMHAGSLVFVWTPTYVKTNDIWWPSFYQYVVCYVCRPWGPLYNSLAEFRQPCFNYYSVKALNEKGDCFTQQNKHPKNFLIFLKNKWVACSEYHYCVKLERPQSWRGKLLFTSLVQVIRCIYSMWDAID